MGNLLNYFKIITESSDFKQIRDCLPNLFNGLHNIWVLSAYYSIDDHMEALMERIATIITSKVITSLNLETFFK